MIYVDHKRMAWNMVGADDVALATGGNGGIPAPMRPKESRNVVGWWSR